tara:strand:+ start:7191 stop:7598 length:408 start_codon:yes stop_codon:yes gene_type:complete
MSKLDKNSVSYLNSMEEARQLHTVDVNRKELTLVGAITAPDADMAPEVRTTGNSICFLTGKLDVGVAPVLDMDLATLPLGYGTHNILHLSVSVEAAGGTFTRGTIKISDKDITFDGTPTASDIIHLDGAVYLSQV